MNKKEAIALLNSKLGSVALSNANTHWSNIVNYMADEGWWLNIRFQKFKQDLHLILNDERAGKFLHVQIPANAIQNPETVFRNKNGEADIFMPCSGANRLIDTQSGSARHNFSVYKIDPYPYR